MDLKEIAFRRLRTQRLVGKGFASAAEAVRWFGAVQSQEYEWSKWALGLRVDNATSSTIEGAIRDGSIVRSWPMRGTVHMMPAEDVRWMLELMAYRQNEKFMPFLKKLGLTEAILSKARPVLEKELADGPVERRTLYEALTAAGILKDRSWGTHIIGYWSQTGLICPGPLSGKQPTVTLLDKWVPTKKSLQLEKVDALKLIAERYFRSHGPASLQDFTWWTGLSAADAGEALAMIKSSLISIDHESKTFWMSKETAGLDLAADSSAHLLPPFDEYTVAYKNREAAIAAAELQSMQHGIFTPTILIDGRIVGSWSRKLLKNTASLELTTKPLKPAEEKLVMQAASEYSKFIELPVQLERRTL